MNEKNRLKILVGVLCVVLVLLTSVVALILDSQSPNPVFGIFQTEPIASTEEPQNSTETTEGSSQETEIPVSTEELRFLCSCWLSPQRTTSPTGSSKTSHRISRRARSRISCNWLCRPGTAC